MKSVLLGTAVAIVVALFSTWALADTGAALPTKDVPVHQAVLTADGPQADVQQVQWRRGFRRGVYVVPRYHYGWYGPSYRTYYGWGTPYYGGYTIYRPYPYYYSYRYPYYRYYGYHGLWY